MSRRALVLAPLFLMTACAGRRAVQFAPASVDESARILASWQQSVERADVGPARLLYDAKVSQGPFRMSGTLAVKAGPRAIEATLSGPFGDTLASYRDGLFTGKNIKTLAIDEQDLRWFLAGAWRGAGQPEIGGTNGGDALLRWSGRERVEAVLDVSSSRVRSLEVRRKEGAIRATYPQDRAGRPRQIELEDLASGNAMKLTLVAAEPVRE